jgi:hypothetical protein
MYTGASRHAFQLMGASGGKREQTWPLGVAWSQAELPR